jgi:CubicO group peptidase (beta-lactamase class C family)
MSILNKSLTLIILFGYALLHNSVNAASDIKNMMELYANKGHHNRIESPFNGVMLVVKDDKVLLKKAYGFANKSKDISLTTSTPFLIGSITKQFTAMLVLQQVERGVLDLNKSVADYLPYFPKQNGQALTIHRLLSHTSGLPHYEGLQRLNIDMDEFTTQKTTPKSYAKIIGNMSLVNKPGTQFYYSSQNYILLGAILEQVTGLSFKELLEKNIVKPLGLTHTGYANNDELKSIIATGYKFKEVGFFSELFSSEKGEYTLAKNRHQSNTYTTGGMHSTVDDLYLWSKAIKQHKILSKALTTKMFTPNLGGYGYGWFINHETMIRFNPSIQLISHGGSLDGYSSNIAMYKDGTTIIFLSNVTPVGDIRLTMNMHLSANNIAIDDFKRDIKLPNINGDIDDFNHDGGIAALRRYYQEISTRAGYNVKLSQWGYQELIKLYLSENKLTQAVTYYHEMLEQYTTPSKQWINQIGYDFLIAKSYKSAIDIFKLNTRNYSYSAGAFDSLGDAYRANGQFEFARVSYQQAIVLANKNKGRNLSYYQAQLDSLPKNN